MIKLLMFKTFYSIWCYSIRIDGIENTRQEASIDRLRDNENEEKGKDREEAEDEEDEEEIIEVSFTYTKSTLLEWCRIMNHWIQDL